VAHAVIAGGRHARQARAATPAALAGRKRMLEGFEGKLTTSKRAALTDLNLQDSL
jgi:hypothetical protein